MARWAILDGTMSEQTRGNGQGLGVLFNIFRNSIPHTASFTRPDSEFPLPRSYGPSLVLDAGKPISNDVSVP